jgi:hypothetical protein
MRSILALAAFIVCATSSLSGVVADSTALKAFLANAWTCLDQDIPADTKDLRLESSRKTLQLTLERMGRFSQALDVQVRVVEKTSDPSRRASVRQRAMEAIATLEADAKEVTAFRSAGVPSLGSEASQNLFQRLVEELEATRSRIAEK